MSATLSDPVDPAAAPRARTSPAVLVLLVFLALIGTAMLFAVAMTRIVNYDEDQYIAAGIMAQTMMPYRDFMYLQGPLYPFVLAGLFKAFPGYALLTARLLTFGLSLTSAGLLWGILRRLGAAPVLAAVLLAACLASPFLVQPLSNTRNDILPLTLMLAGLLVHLWAVDRSWAGRLLTALLFGLAVEAKVTYLFGPIALGIHALFDVRRRLLPYVFGTALAAAPAAACFWMAPEAFRFGLLDYHLAAPHDWYGRQGLEAALLPATKLVDLLGWLVLGGNLTLVVLAGALSVIAMARGRKWKRPGRLLLGLFLGALVLAFVPSPSWAVYYAAIPPLLACCIAHLDRVTTHLADPARKRILVLVAAFPTIMVLVLAAPEINLLRQWDRWVGLEAHRTALSVYAALPHGGAVATLYPHFVVDVNPVPPAFATGPFVFRSGDLWPADRLARLHALSPATLAAAFDVTPPAAIFAGAYPEQWPVPMDIALTRYAETHGWRPVYTDPGGGRLWVRP